MHGIFGEIARGEWDSATTLFDLSAFLQNTYGTAMQHTHLILGINIVPACLTLAELSSSNDRLGLKEPLLIVESE